MKLSDILNEEMSYPAIVQAVEDQLIMHREEGSEFITLSALASSLQGMNMGEITEEGLEAMMDEMDEDLVKSVEDGKIYFHQEGDDGDDMDGDMGDMGDLADGAGPEGGPGDELGGPADPGMGGGPGGEMGAGGEMPGAPMDGMPAGGQPPAMQPPAMQAPPEMMMPPGGYVPSNADTVKGMARSSNPLA